MEKWAGVNLQRERFGCPCKVCQKRYKANGGIAPTLEGALFEVVQELEKFYRHIGRELSIDTGILCEAENDRRKGKKESPHLQGCAVTFRVTGESGESLRGRIETLIKLRIMKNGGLATFVRDSNLAHYDLRKTGAARWVEK